MKAIFLPEDVIYAYEMAYASGHYEQMEYLMRAPQALTVIKSDQLECIYYTAHCVDHTARIEPYESGCGDMGDERGHGKDHDPTHGYVYDRGYPFRAGDPYEFKHHAGKSQAPYDAEKDGPVFAHGANADRSIGSRDQYEDHHMVETF